jgi:hypothetical protein
MRKGVVVGSTTSAMPERYLKSASPDGRRAINWLKLRAEWAAGLGVSGKWKSLGGFIRDEGLPERTIRRRAVMEGWGSDLPTNASHPDTPDPADKLRALNNRNIKKVDRLSAKLLKATEKILNEEGFVMVDKKGNPVTVGLAPKDLRDIAQALDKVNMNQRLNAEKPTAMVLSKSISLVCRVEDPTGQGKSKLDYPAVDAGGVGGPDEVQGDRRGPTNPQDRFSDEVARPGSNAGEQAARKRGLVRQPDANPRKGNRMATIPGPVSAGVHRKQERGGAVGGAAGEKVR